MSRAHIVDDLLRVLQDGYQPYAGEVDATVYEELVCARPRKARWFVREERRICLGCSRRCVRATQEGFELLLPVSAKKRVKTAFAHLPMVSARQLMESKLLLRVDEAAFVLNISESEVRNYVDEGRLVAHPDPPLRVTVESVGKAFDN